MHSYFSSSKNKAIPIIRVDVDKYQDWLKSQNDKIANWVSSLSIKGRAGDVIVLPSVVGFIEKVVVVDREGSSLWDYAANISSLKPGQYILDKSFNAKQASKFFLAWGLSAYRFDRYTKKEYTHPTLCERSDLDMDEIKCQIEGTNLVRDLINTPANDMGPVELADQAMVIAKKYKAKIEITVDRDLLKENYPAVYTVGMASARAPRLIDMRWGSEKNTKITLVGKGVCFDSGGLDIKPSSGMLTMKKDMGGAAHVLALAQMIMASKLPVCLRVLVPAVENSISGVAYRPMDVIKMRSGKTVEVGNTDAEGRLILADALHEASSEKPDLIIDCATLTGAARIAMGTEVGVMFCNDDKIANQLQDLSIEESDPMWRMPLWEGYRAGLRSKVADMSSTGASSYGGAITAALFLSEFIENKTPWVHLDIMAWNTSDKPGRQEGGEAMGLRALFAFIKKFTSK